MQKKHSMDAFVDKVRDPDVSRSVRVVSERSLHSVELARLRASQRHLIIERDRQLSELGKACVERLDALDIGGEATRSLAAGARAVRDIESLISVLEQRIARAQMARRLSSAHLPFLTVCPCGSPLLSSDTSCPACARDVEALVTLATESKARVRSISCGCGTSLVSGIRFCPSCGHDVSALLAGAGLPSCEASPVCGRCGDSAAPGDRYCSACGASLT